jgi:hypothetical protein
LYVYVGAVVAELAITGVIDQDYYVHYVLHEGHILG